MLGARIGGCSACISGDGSGVGIDVQSTGQSGCGPSRRVSADGNGVGGLNGKGYPGVEGDQGVRGYDHRSGFTADCGVQATDLAVGEGDVVKAEVLQATLEPIAVSVFTGSKVNVLILFDPYGVVHRCGLNGRAIDVGLCNSRVALVGEGDHGPLFGRDPIGVVDPHIGVGAHSKAVVDVTAVGVVVVTKFEKVVSAASGEYCAPSAGADFVTQPDVCGVLAIGRHAHDPMVGDGDLIVGASAEAHRGAMMAWEASDGALNACSQAVGAPILDGGCVFGLSQREKESKIGLLENRRSVKDFLDHPVVSFAGG